MSRIHVCPLSQLGPTVTASGASHLVTLINQGTPVQRPPSIPIERHLFLALNDIDEPSLGLIAPGRQHLALLLEFAADWDRAHPMVVHCYAGISRSTAAAFALVCAMAPARSERAVAEALRRASPTATPNRLIVALADQVLSRRGRMIDAIEAIGRGSEAVEGAPFALDIDA